MNDPAEKQLGEMPEWSIGAVSKTVERFAFQGFESLSLRKETDIISCISTSYIGYFLEVTIISCTIKGNQCSL